MLATKDLLSHLEESAMLSWPPASKQSKADFENQSMLFSICPCFRRQRSKVILFEEQRNWIAWGGNKSVLHRLIVITASCEFKTTSLLRCLHQGHPMQNRSFIANAGTGKWFMKSEMWIAKGDWLPSCCLSSSHVTCFARLLSLNFQRLTYLFGFEK